jgi:hypothetical protein
MPGRLTVYGARELLTTYFAQITEPPPNFYLALIREVAPTPYMSGSELDEPDAPDYARAEVPNDLANWSNESQPQEISNALWTPFTTATSDWGKIGYWALCNAPVDGFNILVGELENPVLVEAGDDVAFEEGDLNVSLGPFFLAEED